jgi:glutamate synthase (NADPH/NADH) large chain
MRCAQTHNILIVSDRNVSADQSRDSALLATSTIHQHLVGRGLRIHRPRRRTGSARETHHLRPAGGLRRRSGHHLAVEPWPDARHGPATCPSYHHLTTTRAIGKEAR